MEISAKEIQEKLNKNILIIDVRSPVEYEDFHLDGTINIPLDQLNPNKVKEMLGDKELYTICLSGKRGNSACCKLMESGLKVINISGGTNACKEAGLPIIYGKKSVSMERQVRIGAGLFILMGFFGSFFLPSLIYISAVVGAGLLFSGITDTCGMALVLTKMPWNKNVKSCGVK